MKMIENTKAVFRSRR